MTFIERATIEIVIVISALTAIRHIVLERYASKLESRVAALEAGLDILRRKIGGMMK